MEKTVKFSLFSFDLKLPEYQPTALKKKTKKPRNNKQTQNPKRNNTTQKKLQNIKHVSRIQLKKPTFTSITLDSE